MASNETPSRCTSWIRSSRSSAQSTRLAPLHAQALVTLRPGDLRVVDDDTVLVIRPPVRQVVATPHHECSRPGSCVRRVWCGNEGREPGRLETFVSDAKISRQQSPVGGREAPSGAVLWLRCLCHAVGVDLLRPSRRNLPTKRLLNSVRTTLALEENPNAFTHRAARSAAPD